METVMIQAVKSSCVTSRFWVTQASPDSVGGDYPKAWMPGGKDHWEPSWKLATTGLEGPVFKSPLATQKLCGLEQGMSFLNPTFLSCFKNGGNNTY